MGWLNSKALGATLAFALLASAACSDSPTGPKGPELVVDAAELMPAVQDARLRLVPVIENQGVRDRIAYDMQEIETALTQGDGQKVRYHVRIAGGILIDYRNGLANVVKDGPDVGGIALALYAVAVKSGGSFDITALH
jgi:hypothetical protein